MNRFFFFSILLFLSFVSTAQQRKRVLFLGNSYTYVNNLPSMVQQLAGNTLDTLIQDSNTPGGCTLEMHTTLSASLSKIAQGNWDYVVLQEQSQRPAFPLSQVQQEFFPFLIRLDSLIQNQNTCAQSLLYQTWGRKNGDASNCSFFPPICTYNGMDSLLRLRYSMASDSIDAPVCPVGAVRRYIIQNSRSIELYMSDESHPSLEGTYAAALSFYTAIFKRNPLLTTYNPGIDPNVADTIKRAVKAVVFDSLTYWKLDGVKPNAQFSSQLINSTTVKFFNTSTKAHRFLWNFGDGQFSTDTNPVHTYASPGIYHVILVADRCPFVDSAGGTALLIAGVQNKWIEEPVKTWVKDAFTLEIEGLHGAEPLIGTLSELSGKQVFQFLKPIEDERIQIRLPQPLSGVYILQTNRGKAVKLVFPY